MASEQFAGIAADDFGERQTGKRTISHAAGAIGVVGNFPAFGIIGFRPETAAKQRLELSAAPADPLEYGSEGKRRQGGTGGHDAGSAFGII